MATVSTKKNRYKFSFGEKQLTLETEHDNLFMETVERIVTEKYTALQEALPTADAETVALALAVNSISLSLLREEAYTKQETELAILKKKVLKKNVTLLDLDEIEEIT